MSFYWLSLLMQDKIFNASALGTQRLLEMIPENLLDCALKRPIVQEFASMTVVKCLLQLHLTKMDAFF